MIRGLAEKGISARVRLDADTLGQEEAAALGLGGDSFFHSGPGPVVIDAVSIPDAAATWLADFSLRILISPVCDRADLATHALVREAPEKLRGDLPDQSELVTDLAFGFITARGLRAQPRDYASLTLGICLSGGDDRFDLNGLLGELSWVRGLDEIRLLDRRIPEVLPDYGPKLMHTQSTRRPWVFLGPANVFLGGEGVMLAEAVAQGIPAFSLSATSDGGKNTALVDTGSVKLIPRAPFEPASLISMLSDRRSLEEMHKSALHNVGVNSGESLVGRIVDLLSAGDYPK